MTQRNNSVLRADYETFGEVDLIQGGLYNYARDPATDIIVFGYAFDLEEPQLWWPEEDPFPDDVLEHLNAGRYRSIKCHNAAFERLITQYVLPRYVKFTQPPLEAWDCSAAQARARTMPGKLEDLGACLESIMRRKPA